MQIAIIAGGLGTRLGPITKNTPKSMIMISGKPFIEHQMQLLKKAGIDNIVLCLGHQSELIQDYCGDGSKFGLNIKYSCESNPLDTAGALKLASHLLEDYFFTLYGDSYILVDFYEMLTRLLSKNKLALMSVYKNSNQFDRSNTIIENDVVTYYNKEKSEGCNYIDYGVNLFNKDVLRFVPENTSYSLGTLFAKLIEQKELLAYQVEKRFYEIGSFYGLKEFSKYIEEVQ
jgi:NDP-sugar pyrophosphorylase family protein